MNSILLYCIRHWWNLLHNLLLSLQWGKTALMIAYDLGLIECVKMLVYKGAQVNIQDKVSLSGVIIHYMQCNNNSWNS